MFQIGAAILTGRCSYSNENNLGSFDPFLKRRGEKQPVLLNIDPDHAFKTRFVNGNRPFIQLPDLGFVIIDACNRDTTFSKTGPGYQSYITCSHNGNFHISLTVLVLNICKDNRTSELSPPHPP